MHFPSCTIAHTTRMHHQGMPSRMHQGSTQAGLLADAAVPAIGPDEHGGLNDGSIAELDPPRARGIGRAAHVAYPTSQPDLGLLSGGGQQYPVKITAADAKRRGGEIG
jgi:hypothetical protein